MGAVSKKDGFELAMGPFDHKTVMEKRGEKPNSEYKYALCYLADFDPRKSSREWLKNQEGIDSIPF